MRPILQVLSISTLAGQPGRFKIVLSDGEFYTTGLLSSSLITKLNGCPFKQYQLVSLDEYLVNAVQDKVFILVHGMTEVTQPLSAGQVGNPQVYRPVPGTVPLVNSVGNPVAASQVPRPPAASVNPYQSAVPAAQPQGQQPLGGGLPSHSPFAAGMAQSAPLYSSSGAPHQQQPYVGQTAGPVRYLQPTDCVIPMSQLTIYTQKWTIKARVSAKSDMRTFRNAKGEGQLMTIDIVDHLETEMRATFFGSAAQKFHPLLQVGQVYTFSRGSVKPANPKFNPKAQYELMFDEHSEIVAVGEDASIPTMRIAPVAISSLADTPVGQSVDVIAVIVSAGELASVTIKSTGRETTKLSLTVCDDSGSSVELTVWGDKAQKILFELKQKQANATVVVLLAKACKVGDFNGRSLSTSPSSVVELDPANNAKSALLKSWWAGPGKSAQLSSLSGGGGSGGGASGIPSAGPRTPSIQAMRVEDVGTLMAAVDVSTVAKSNSVRRTVNNHLLKATLVHVPMRDANPLYYKSCPSEVDDGKGGHRLCQKKAELQAGDVYVCAEQHCNKTANPRFILSMRLQDATGECVVRAFHDQAKAILGVDASDIDSSSDPVVAQQVAVDNALFKAYLVRIRSKKEFHMDEERLNSVITDVSPLTPNADATYMLTAVRGYLGRVAGGG